jgi:hypothetical protein
MTLDEFHELHRVVDYVKGDGSYATMQEYNDNLKLATEGKLMMTKEQFRLLYEVEEYDDKYPNVTEVIKPELYDITLELVSNNLRKLRLDEFMRLYSPSLHNHSKRYLQPETYIQRCKDFIIDDNCMMTIDEFYILYTRMSCSKSDILWNSVVFLVATYVSISIFKILYNIV